MHEEYFRPTFQGLYPAMFFFSGGQCLAVILPELRLILTMPDRHRSE